MTHPATQLIDEPIAVEITVRDQMAMTRSAVAAAEDDRLAHSIHPARWERRGLFRRLRRRAGLSEVA